jgi:hypothetical protein
VFDNFIEEIVIMYDWYIWCDDDGKLGPMKVMEAKVYSEDEKKSLLAMKKNEDVEEMKTSWMLRKPILGEFNTILATNQWETVWNIRKKYLACFIPDWIMKAEDIELLAANICTEQFVTNVKKFVGKEKNFQLSYNTFVPTIDRQKETREEYLKRHPYISEAMECFVSTKWDGPMDYPGGEILCWQKLDGYNRIICARRNDWEYTMEYVSIDFILCKVITLEYDLNIKTYTENDETHSFVQLCGARIFEGCDRKCRFHFLIRDEYGKYNNLVLECDDVRIRYNQEL